MSKKQVAILIDGDNIAPKYAEYIKQEALQYGNVSVFRLYGSITTPNVRSWYRVMPVQGILPMLQMSYVDKKSIADQALTIDAMDLLYSNQIDVFCIVSSDCDFTKLVYRLKESGKIVIGMGEKKTKEALAQACNEFKILDLIYKDANSDKEEIEVAEESETSLELDERQEEVKDNENEIVNIDVPEITVPSEEEIVDCIYEYIELLDDSKVNLAEIGNFLKQKFLGFDARNYGYKTMTKMLEGHADKLAVDREKAEDGKHEIVYIRIPGRV